MSVLSPSIINAMANSGAIPLPVVAAQAAPPNGQPPVNPVSPVSFGGIAQAGGVWASVAPGVLTNPSLGTYQVTHSRGLGNHSVSASCVGVTTPFGVQITSMDANQFTVQITDGSGNPVALPWAFTLSTVG